MNKSCLLIVAGMFIFNQSDTQAQSSGIILDVKRQPGQQDDRVNYKVTNIPPTNNTSWSMALSIMARNVGMQTNQGKLEWYFLAKELCTKTVWIFDQGYIPVALTPMWKTNVTIKAKPIDNFKGYNPKLGNVIEGYIIRVVSETNILAITASSKGYESVGKDDAQFHSLLEKSKSKSIYTIYYLNFK